MKFIPHEYQTHVINYLMNHTESAVFLDMGLGKTVCALTAIRNLIIKRKVDKVLVIAPIRVANNTWPDEIEKWDHLHNLDYIVATGNEKERLKALQQNKEITIINRENVDWLINKSGYVFDFDTLIIDELSSFKSYSSKRFKSLLQVRSRIKRIIGLTGTPSSNGLMDLWAEMRLIDGGVRLERYITRYRLKYFTPDKKNGAIVYSYKLIPGAEDEIYKKISDITISMKAVDFIDMPELLMNNIEVKMDTDEKRAYDMLKREMVVSLNEIEEIDAVNAAALSGKLLQMANGAVYNEDKIVVHIHDKKLDALEDLIEQANGKPVLIAYWFHHDLERIKSRFNVREIKTDNDIRDWNNGLIPVALIHPASAGHGLNLQDGGSQLIWFGLTWSLELYEQTNCRLYRQGQKNPVVIHHIITKDTIDEDVLRALRRKEKTQASLIEAVKARIGG